MRFDISSIWHLVSENGINNQIEESEQKRIRFLNRIIFINALLALFFLAIDISNLSFDGALISLTTLIFSSILLALIRKEFYKITKWAILFFIIIYISSLAVMTGKNSGMIIYFIPGILFPTIIFKNKKVVLVLTVFLLFALFGVFNLTENLIPRLKLSENELRFYSISSLMGCSIITLLILWYFRKTNEEYEEIIFKKNKSLRLYSEEVSIKKAKLEQKNKGITDSINYASKIQQSILPNEKKLTAFLSNYFLFFCPKDIVSGDFYWIEKIETKKYIAIADCTGHGVPGAMVSVICQNALNRSVQEYKLTKPNEILDKTREIVIDALSEGDKMIQDGMDIALCCIDTNTNILEFSGANNPLVIVRNNEFMILNPDRQPIGKYSFGKPFKVEKKKLENDDCIYMFTDGFSDQFGGKKGKKFKSSSLINLLSSNSKLSLEKQHKALETEFINWKGDFEQIDDVCILGFKI